MYSHTAGFWEIPVPPEVSTLAAHGCNFAKTVLISCELGSHIHPAGFHDWNKTEAHGTIFYAEYNSVPSDADNCTAGSCRSYPHRADFVTALDAVEAAHFTRQNVLCGTDNWLVSDVESC